MHIFHRYNRPKFPGTVIEGESRTQQSMKKECDINTIVRRAQQTGVWPPKPGPEVFADVSNVQDYQAALHIVMQAEEMFSQLPAVLRARFSNNPEEFIAYATDGSNAEEMIKLGLATKRPPVVEPEAAQPSKKAKKEEVASEKA